MEEKKLPFEGYWDSVFNMRTALQIETDASGILKFPLMANGKVWSDMTLIIMRKTPSGEMPNLPWAYYYALNCFDGNEEFRKEHVNICGDNWWHCD